MDIASEGADQFLDAVCVVKIMTAAKFQHRVMTHLSILRHNQAEMLEMLAAYQQKRCDTEMEMLRQPEQSLYMGLVHFFQVHALMSYDSRTLNLTVKGMMAYIMSNQAACEFSMDGRKGKLKFRELKFTKIVLSAVQRTRHHKECTLDDVVHHIKEWLRRAKERCAASEKSSKAEMQDQ
ncbi:uncharacterized protein LOC119184606 [Rhipicephalus microplus]|uniref:uncharacterized protein LOC119184606 n=1 Tax=Rhipicephalus microplus TaxID=6941 RepID=UPI003F6B852A